MSAVSSSSKDSISVEAMTRVQEIYARHQETFIKQIQDLEDAAVAALYGQLDQAAQMYAQRQAHKLAGSAGTFGFPRVSEIARELERELESFIPGSDAVRRIADMAVVIRDAMMVDPKKRDAPSVSTVDRPFVLLLDSDDDFSAQLVLEGAGIGMSVVAVNAFEDAQRLIRSGPDAALFSLSGESENEHVFSLLEQLGKQDPPVPALILTKTGDFTDRVEVARRGGRGFLQKPLLPSQVLDAVSQVIDRARVGSMKVLAVDDDPPVLDAIQVLLEARELSVIKLDDPSAFWTTIEQVSPDLLVLDVDMPDVNGVELCKVVRNDPRWSELPILFLTAKNDYTTINLIFESGADDYVAKPIVGPELLMRITNRLERLRLHRRIAETDPLTGAANRRKTIDVMDRLMHLSERFGQPLSVALLDIDRFKTLNDTNGHFAGDRVLRDLAGILLRAFRGEDIVGRWGGGEFFIGMYGMRGRDAVQRIAEVLESFRDMKFEGSKSSFHSTFSAGIAELGKDGSNLQDLYASANAAVVAAKDAGRDRVVSAHSIGEVTSSAIFDLVLVEDDESLAQLLMHAFETRGLRAHWISTGTEAAADLSGAMPKVRGRVVILDWDLPGMSGPAVLHRLSEWGTLERTKVIMLTGRTTESEVLSSFERGALDHIAKPFSVPVLMQRIRRFLE